MAEKRRLFIDPNRLNDEIDFNGEIELNSHETHYLLRVLRLRSEDPLEVVDGKGHSSLKYFLILCSVQGSEASRCTITLFRSHRQ